MPELKPKWCDAPRGCYMAGTCLEHRCFEDVPGCGTCGFVKKSYRVCKRCGGPGGEWRPLGLFEKVNENMVLCDDCYTKIIEELTQLIEVLA